MGAPTTTTEARSNPQEAVRDVGKTDASSALVDNIFRKLTDEQKEQAARASSYRYLVASSSPASEEGHNDQRDEYAKAAIQRYISVEQKLGNSKSPEASALEKLQNTLAYREEKRIDDLRLCFDKDRLADEEGLHSTLREQLIERYATKASIVRGYTKDGRAMFQNFARADTDFENNEYYLKGNIYMLERALACTERTTNGEKDKVVIFYDYTGYGMKNSPPVKLVMEVMYDLRDHWPERLHRVYIVDSPFIFRAFWAIVKHFLDPITKGLVHFVTGEEQKKVFREMVDEDQAAPYMFDDGRDEGEADNSAFFYDTPFDHVYGETQGQS